MAYDEFDHKDSCEEPIQINQAHCHYDTADKPYQEEEPSRHRQEIQWPKKVRQ